ncbi:MAG: symmetrical bis(5'-nucleosyl)-tetraphosphatase [Gammaproteobacteria bacterium]|nr:symmetrical bis(5'-nucleosyl)-tetraphosphatase [Gammaproteobacteria bacterium]
MTTYAIGDIQGCFEPLQRLLEKIQFDPAQDTLWFAGDLVNRGPNSLAVLRFIKGLGDSAISVLGNHDLHMLAVANGHLRYHKKDTFHDVLDAPDRDQLLDWLRHRPLIHHDDDLGVTLLHAGLPPQWDLSLAQQCAREVETCLQACDYGEFLGTMYGNEPNHWDELTNDAERRRFIINCFTRLRYCDDAGALALEEKGTFGTQAAGLEPWFALTGRASRDLSIVFGHWSTIGGYIGNGVVALDTGCVWGNRLSALPLDGTKDGAGVLISVDAMQDP